jgi:hypothetical protein
MVMHEKNYPLVLCYPTLLLFLLVVWKFAAYFLSINSYTLEEHQTPPYILPLLDKIVLSIYHHYFYSLAITLSGMDSEIKRFMLRTQSTSGLLTFRGMINPSCPIWKYIDTTFTLRVLLTVSIQKQPKIILSQYLTPVSGSMTACPGRYYRYCLPFSFRGI